MSHENTTPANFTISFRSIKVNGTPRHEATVYANSKKIYSTYNLKREKARQEAAALVRNLKLYGYSPEKPVGVHEEVWFLFRELKDAGKLPQHLRASILLHRHRWTEEQAQSMLDTLREIASA